MRVQPLATQCVHQRLYGWRSDTPAEGAEQETSAADDRGSSAKHARWTRATCGEFAA